MAEVAHLLDLAAGELEGTEIPKVEVVVGALGLELVAVLDEFGAESAGVGNDLSGVGLEGRVSSLLEGDSNTSNGLQKEKAP